MRTFIGLSWTDSLVAGFWGKLEIPGLPTRMFDPEPSEEATASGESELKGKQLPQS
jgi:hypothetical protein